MKIFYRLYITRDGEDVIYGSSSCFSYMQELIDDYIRMNGNSGDVFSFKIKASLK